MANVGLPRQERSNNAIVVDERHGYRSSVESIARPLSKWNPTTSPAFVTPTAKLLRGWATADRKSVTLPLNLNDRPEHRPVLVHGGLTEVRGADDDAGIVGPRSPGVATAQDGGEVGHGRRRVQLVGEGVRPVWIRNEPDDQTAVRDPYRGRCRRSNIRVRIAETAAPTKPTFPAPVDRGPTT